MEHPDRAADRPILTLSKGSKTLSKRDDPQLILHIGLHKTGTTFLQQAVFRHWRGLGYVGRPLQRDTIRAIAESSSHAVLFSNESLSGSLIDAYDQRQSGAWIDRQVNQIRRLGQLFPAAQVMIGFRYQTGWLLSIYKHYLKYGGTRSLDEFLGEDGSSVLSMDDLRFRPRLEATMEAFPRGVFPFFWEELNMDSRSLYEDMATFLRLDPPEWEKTQGTILNEGVNERQAKLLRHWNSLSGGLNAGGTLQRLRFRSARVVGGLGPSSRLRLPERIRRMIEARLDDDWTSLAQTVAGLRGRHEQTEWVDAMVKRRSVANVDAGTNT